MPALAVFTNRRRLHGPLLAVPDVRSWQRGDDELRAIFPADPPAILKAVAGIIRAKRRRPPGSAAHLIGTGYTFTSQPPDATLTPTEREDTPEPVEVAP
jgi:hypothetical protein